MLLTIHVVGRRPTPNYSLDVSFSADKTSTMPLKYTDSINNYALLLCSVMAGGAKLLLNEWSKELNGVLEMADVV